MLTLLSTDANNANGMIEEMESYSHYIDIAALLSVVFLLSMFTLNIVSAIRSLKNRRKPNRWLLFATCGIFMFLFVTNIIASAMIAFMFKEYDSIAIIVFSTWFVMAVAMICVTVAALRLCSENNDIENTKAETYETG